MLLKEEGYNVLFFLFHYPWMFMFCNNKIHIFSMDSHTVNLLHISIEHLHTTCLILSDKEIYFIN